MFHITLMMIFVVHTVPFVTEATDTTQDSDVFNGTGIPAPCNINSNNTTMYEVRFTDKCIEVCHYKNLILLQVVGGPNSRNNMANLQYLRVHNCAYPCRV